MTQPIKSGVNQDKRLDATLVVVDAKVFDRFRKFFNGPAKRNRRLRKLMAMKAPWEN
ncbi:hypothetical protein [Methylocystis iwaonis]|uniref:hypothetical protein n=1 Tax=Methylocystis iwaonis TaxID=2885079 RepID=UPI002E7ACB22|nr:hypothetical protein [Methylocystis iwaonis]